MNQYLFAEENRDAISAHNDQLVITTTKAVGKASYVSYDFNRAEEYRKLDDVINAPDVDTQTVRTITAHVYGSDDDALLARVRSSLKYGSPYQQTLRNGTTVTARQDGTLRITRTADEFGALVTENLALTSDRIKKTVTRAIKRMDRDAAAAVDKVPELAEPMGEVRKDITASLTSVLSRQLELLSGDD